MPSIDTDIPVYIPLAAQVRFRASASLHCAAERKARERGMCLSELVRTAIEREVQAS